MPNEFIQIYNTNNLLNNDYLNNAIEALSALKKNRKERIDAEKVQAGKKIGWRGAFAKAKLFFNPELTAKNLVEIDTMLVALNNFKQKNSSGKYSKEDREKICNILGAAKKNLSKGETLELVNHILDDIQQFDYSNRPSSLIHPDAHDAINTDKQIYSAQDEWKNQMNEWLKIKNLRANLFIKTHDPIQLSDPISKHVAWAFRNIYCVAYPTVQAEKIARYHHGIQHVTRAGLYVPVLANLYRKHGDPEADKLTDEDIKLLQIAALYHDSARQNEGVDEWDHESAVFLYSYLTSVLHVEKQKAKLLAEAVANKDPNKKGYFVIEESGPGITSWRWQKEHPAKNIYQKLIHDADCLDIIRARDNFDATHLDFYKQFSEKNALALEEMAHLVTEARSIIDIQGDSRNRTKTDTKLKYENENAYDETVTCLKKDTHPIISRLHGKLEPKETLTELKLVDITPYQPDSKLTEENLRCALREGKVFARGIAAPSAISKKPAAGKDESLAGTEIRKTKRRKGVQTLSVKKPSTEKEGNPFRSVSMLGYGSGVFTNAGFLIVDPRMEDISKVYSVDSNTGRGKKVHLRDKSDPFSAEEKQKQLNDLHTKLKLGGSTVTFSELNHAANHVEILYHIKDYNAIFVSSDPNLYNHIAYGSSEAAHSYSPILQGIYLQKEYSKNNPEKASLPIFEYSGIHNTIRQIKPEELIPEKIKQMWVEMCSDYITQCLSDNKNMNIFTMSIDDIKVMSMYKTINNPYARKNSPADSNYDEKLRKEISDAIETRRNELINKHEQEIIKKIHAGELTLMSDPAFYNLIRNPALSKQIQNEISNTVTLELKNINWSKGNTIIKEFMLLKTGERPLLPKNREEFFSTHDIKDIYYAGNPIRLFELSKLLDQPDLLKQIQANMSAIALDSIDNAYDKLNNNGISSSYYRTYEYNDLKKLINFTTSFEIYPNDLNIKNKLDNLVNLYFKSIFDDIDNKPYKTQSYCEFVLKLHSADMLTDKQKKRATWMVTNLIDEIKNVDRFDDSDLIFLLQLAAKLNCPKTLQVEALTTWLKDKKININNSYYRLIGELSSLDLLINPDSFQEIINHVAINTNPKVLGNEIFYLGNWLETLVVIMNNMPDKQFNTEQLSIIQARFDSLFQKMFNNIDMSAHFSYDIIFINNISELLKSDIPINISQDKFDKINATISKVDLKTIPEGYKKMFKFLHEKLPNPESRIGWNEYFNPAEKTKELNIK